MTDTKLSNEDIDYLEEMMNIGAGNAAGALEQMLKCKFEMHLPVIHIVPPRKAFSVISDPLDPVSCVKMNLIGDINGDIFLIVPQAVKAVIAELAASSAHVKIRDGDVTDTAIIAEIGNILAGVYLTAIHDFCKLNVYHTIPFTAQDMAQAVLDEAIARSGLDPGILIVIINRFTASLSKKSIDTCIMLIPSGDSEKVLLDSIKGARQICGR